MLRVIKIPTAIATISAAIRKSPRTDTGLTFFFVPVDGGFLT
jgi:hypothetical protein